MPVCILVSWCTTLRPNTINTETHSRKENHQPTLPLLHAESDNLLSKLLPIRRMQKLGRPVVRKDGRGETVGDMLCRAPHHGKESDELGPVVRVEADVGVVPVRVLAHIHQVNLIHRT